MAGKGIVGKLAVKIVPDLDGFVRDLHAKLREEARKVRDLQVEVRAQVRVDDGALTRLQQRLDSADTVIKAAVSGNSIWSMAESVRSERPVEEIVADIERLNGISGALRPGQRVVVPVR